MKKFIILGLVVLFTFLSAQGLHKIPKPMRVSGWIKIGGDFMPIWTEKYDIGDSSYWFDSSFIAHGWFKYLRVDSGGYLKLDSADYSTLTADSVNAEKVVVKDTIFTDFIVANDSDVIYVGATGLTETDSMQVNSYIKSSSDTISYNGTATNRWKEVWALRLMGTDGTKADTFSMHDDGTSTFLNTDNYFTFRIGGIARIYMTSTGFAPAGDTALVMGTATARWKEFWGLRYCWSDGTKADSGKIHDDGTDTWITTDNPVKFSNDVKPDSFFLPYATTVKDGVTDYACCFVDTVGTDSLIIMVGATRRGFPIE